MFELFISFFNIVLYQPLFNALVFLYEFLPYNDFGIAVIVLTILIRLVLYPLGTKGIKAQKALSELQPKMKEIQTKYKHDKEKQAKEMMELYKREKINPLSGCLPLLIQLPIIIALYRVFWQGFQPEQLVHLYSFTPFSGTIDPSFLGIINLAAPCIWLAFLAGALQFIQTKMMVPRNIASAQKRDDKGKSKDSMGQFSDMMQKQMLYFFPVFTVLILWRMPSAIGLYWIVFTLFAIVQQHFTLKSTKKDTICLNKKI